MAMTDNGQYPKLTPEFLDSPEGVAWANRQSDAKDKVVADMRTGARSHTTKVRAKRREQGQKAKEQAKEQANDWLGSFKSISQLRGEYQKPVYLIRKWWPVGSAGVVGGPEKSLKTWAMLGMSAAVALGKPLFNHPDFATTQGRVLYLTGEGGQHLTLDRLDHLCTLYGVNTAELDGQLFINPALITANTPEFSDVMGQAIANFDPVFVVVDPAYVYLDAGDTPGNVFKMGKALATIRDACQGRALAVGHHTNKPGSGGGKDKFTTLTDLTQAGFREFADSWILLSHREEPDLDEQCFTLNVNQGGRRGFGGQWVFDVDLGPFDDDTLTHQGVPSWKVLTRAEGDKELFGNVKDQARKWAIELVKRESNTHTKTDLEAMCPNGRNTGRDVIAELLDKKLFIKKDKSRLVYVGGDESAT